MLFSLSSDAAETEENCNGPSTSINLIWSTPMYKAMTVTHPFQIVCFEIFHLSFSPHTSASPCTIFPSAAVWTLNSLTFLGFSATKHTEWCCQLTPWLTDICHAVMMTFDFFMQLTKMSATNLQTVHGSLAVTFYPWKCKTLKQLRSSGNFAWVLSVKSTLWHFSFFHRLIITRL